MITIIGIAIGVTVFHFIVTVFVVVSGGGGGLDLYAY